MSSYKLALGHIGDEARVTSCFFIDCLLLLRYVLVVCHNNAVKLVSFLRNAPFRRKGTKKIRIMQVFMQKKQRSASRFDLYFYIDEGN